MNDESIDHRAAANFLHREIFHLKPRKADRFRVCLVGEYSSSFSSQQQSQANTVDNVSSSNPYRPRPRVSLFHSFIRRGFGRVRRDGQFVSSTNGSIIKSVRQMNGCYSFDIYCRFDGPLEGEGDKASIQDKSSTSLSSGTASVTTSTALSSKSGAECEDKSAEAEITELTMNPAKSGRKSSRTTKDLNERKGPPSSLPHQFMVMGRWENRRAYEDFFLDEGVQSFFCPLISHNVIKSLPILTMWRKENGSHTRMHNDNSDLAEQCSSSGTSSDHFVMTRKRALKDSSNSQQVLTTLKTLARTALKKKGDCSLYEICTTGHSDFNQNEILEVSIWESADIFALFTTQACWRDCNASLQDLFNYSQEEMSFWTRPTFDFPKAGEEKSKCVKK